MCCSCGDCGNLRIFSCKAESQMARLRRSGASFSSLYEYKITLMEVISGLGFRPLSKKAESFVRYKMGRAIGEWIRSEGDYQASDAKLYIDAKLDIDPKLDIEDIQQSLNRLATRLDQVNDILSAVEGGIHHIHFIELAGQITSALSENPEIGSIEEAQKFLTDFRDRAGTVAHGARVATWLLSTLPKRRPGRIQQGWHDDFTRAVTRVCELNAVPIVLSTNRDSGKPEGRFFDAAAALEQLLPRRMRAPSGMALLRRLDRSRKRIKASRAAK